MLKKVDGSYYEITGRRLNSISHLKLFNILRDVDETKLLNVWRSFTFNDEVIYNTPYYETYEVENDDWWDNIAYKFYGTPNLWWVVSMMNNVVNPFEELEIGSNIKILREQYLYQLLKEIRSIADL